MTLDQFIAENDAKPQAERLSNVAIAEKFHTSEASVRRHRKILNRGPKKDEFFQVPLDAITSRGASIRTADGSWQKITYIPEKAAIAEASKFDDLLGGIEGFTADVAQDCDSDMAMVFGGADYQIGKAGESGGGTKDTIRRVLTSASRFAQRAVERKPQAIVVTDCGDITENMFNVPGHQLSTNDLDLADQIRVARRLQLEVLKMLSPLAPEVYYVSVPSNHGQVRTGPKAAVGGVENDFGVEISYQLEDICEIAESPALRNVQFVRPDKYEETAVLTVADTTLAFNHGHRASGGQAGQNKWWTEQDHGRQPGWNADILVVAHYHNLRLEQSGDGRWIIHLSASEPSSDYFARSKGTTSKRGVTCFSVQRGVWSDLEIL